MYTSMQPNKEQTIWNKKYAYENCRVISRSQCLL